MAREGVTVWSAPLCTMRQKMSQSLSGWKIFCKIFWTFQTIVGAAVEPGGAASLMSVRESVPVEIFDYLLHRASRATPAQRLLCPLLSSFQVFAKCSHKFSWRIFSEKSIEDTIRHNMTDWCQFNCSFSCRKFSEIWTSSLSLNKRVMSHVSCVLCSV